MFNRHIIEKLSSYIDNELSQQDRARVDAHLEKCPRCSKELEQLMLVREKCKIWQENIPDAGFDSSVRNKIVSWELERGKVKMDRKLSKIVVPSGVIACLLLVMFLGSHYMRRGLQGRLADAPDFLGEQFHDRKFAKAESSGKQYEPYYLQSGSELDYALSKKLGVGNSSAFQQPEEWNREQYNRIYENEFKEVTENALSTFSIDVDTASYSNLRRFLNNNQMPPEDAVRIEEMINYFSYDYPQAPGQDPFSITTEVSTCPWANDHYVMLVGLQGKRLQSQELPPSNLTFLLDVSGSMADANKLPLLKQAFRMMVAQLRAEDKISIVVYAGAAGMVLEPTPGDQKQTILNAIDQLNSGGSTAGGAGIKLAYETAKKNYITGGNNRVVLATDGDFNVGVSSDAELIRIIEEKRKQGVFLTVLGFGTGNYQDAKMEQLADKGNGNYYYIDTIKEAKKVLVQELGSTLFTIAKDVKIQIEFNPGQVKAYRLIGYENRILNKEDFNDDTKDAGELGTGHTVTALYEFILADSKETYGQVDPLKYQYTQVNLSDDLATVKLRYKKPDEEVSKLLSHVLNKNEIQSANVSNNLAWASSVAEFGMVLRNSQFKGSATYQSALNHAKAAKGDDAYGFRQEMMDLITQAESLDVRFVNSGGGISTK